MERRYIISDASKEVGVEAHVLRYWEEELDLEIPRNERGHRYYRDEDVTVLKTVKTLKEQGFQLKAIKMLLPKIDSIKDLDKNDMELLRQEINAKVSTSIDTNLVVGQASQSIEQSNGNGNKMEQFKEILSRIVVSAMKENNDSLSKDISIKVSDHVNKQLDYIMREQETKQEEYFRNLDETIRNMQRTRTEVAATELSRKEKKKANMFYTAKKGKRKSI